MAEDDNINNLHDIDDQNDDGGEDYQEEEVRRRIASTGQRKRSQYGTRFDILAVPHKRAILDVYQNHGHHFPKDRMERLKHKLQELYAMSPEETEKYFEQLREEANELAKQKVMKILLKRLYHQQQREKQIKKAYRFIEKLFQRGMMHAFINPVPPLLSVRLRNLSDIILEQICDLRTLDIPDRDNTDQCGFFLIAVADWLAIMTEHIYYAVQLTKNEELAVIEEQAAALAKEKKEQKQKQEEKDKEEKKDERRDMEKNIGEDDFAVMDLDLME